MGLDGDVVGRGRPLRGSGAASGAAAAWMKPVTIHARRSIPAAAGCDVSLYCRQDGHPLRRRITLSRSTNFDEAVVSLVAEQSSMHNQAIAWPATARDVARTAYGVFRRTAARLAGPVRHAGPVYDVRAKEPNNLAHLLLEILPACLFVREAFGPDVKFVFRKVNEPFRSLLRLFDINAEFTGRRLQGDMVRLNAMRGLAAHDLLTVFDCFAITMLPHVYEGRSFSYEPTYEKIYLARRGGRSPVNETDVGHLLTRRGYKTIYLEDLPVHGQLAVASGARHVVAVHGAAMSALVLSPRIDSVVEILPSHVFHDGYACCLGHKVKRYALLMDEFDEAVPHNGWPAVLAFKNVRFTVDVGALEQALDEVGG
jgi:glycosyl transferase family 61